MQTIAFLAAHYVMPMKWRVLLLACLVLLAVGLQLAIPQVFKTFIDTATTAGPVKTLYFASGAFLAIALIERTASMLVNYVSTDTGWRATNRLRNDLLEHVLDLDMGFHDQRPPGELAERIDGDGARLENFMSGFFVHLGTGVLLAIGVLVLLVLEDWRLGAMSLVFCAAYLGIHIRSQSIAVPYWQAEREAAASYNGFVNERLAAIRDIRTNAAIPATMAGYFEHNRKRFFAGFKADVVTDVGWTISNMFFTLGFAAAMALGAYLNRQEVISLGAVYLLIHYLELLRSPLDRIRRQVENLQQVRVCSRRTVELLVETVPSIRSGALEALPPGPLGVEFAGVNFAYEDSTPVLEDVSFSIEPGRVVGLVGRTGSGKTSISRLLFRLYSPGSGEIRIGGVRIDQYDLHVLRRGIGFVTQEVQMFRASLRENLRLFDASVSDEQLTDALRAVGLTPWFEALRDGLDTEITPNSGHVSSGEAQLLALTRVMLKNPGLVVLDEPSSHLDAASEAFLYKQVRQLLASRSGLVVAHRLSALQMVDDVLVLESGRVREFGSVESLRRNTRSELSRLLKIGLEGDRQ